MIGKEAELMGQLVSYLWFDNQAEEAVAFYLSLFEGEITNRQMFENIPTGEALEISFTLENMKFAAWNGGDSVKLNSSISVIVTLKSAQEVEDLYAQLMEGGKELMPLDSYPFNERYAWVEDKFGLSWQLLVDENASSNQKLRPSLLFSGQYCGKAEEALVFYQEVFEKAETGPIHHYQEGEAQDERAKINYSELHVLEQSLVLMDNGYGGDFEFNEGYSFLILCSSQAEVDFYFEKLSFVPEAEQSGWVKDPYGVSWLIIPIRLYDLMASSTDEEQARISEALLKMKKLDIEALEDAKYFD